MLIRDVAGRRYALALGKIASDNDSFDSWSDLLGDASVIYSDPASQSLFNNNEISEIQFIDLVRNVFKNIDDVGIGGRGRCARRGSGAAVWQC